MGIEHILYSALNCFDTLVKDHSTIYFWHLYLVYLWALNCFLLIYLSIFMSITHSLNHYSFMVFVADIEKYIWFLCVLTLYSETFLNSSVRSQNCSFLWNLKAHRLSKDSFASFMRNFMSLFLFVLALLHWLGPPIQNHFDFSCNEYLLEYLNFYLSKNVFYTLSWNTFFSWQRILVWKLFFFFQYLKAVIPLSSVSHCFWWEISHHYYWWSPVFEASFPASGWF